MSWKEVGGVVISGWGGVVSRGVRQWGIIAVGR